MTRPKTITPNNLSYRVSIFFSFFFIFVFISGVFFFFRCFILGLGGTFVFSAHSFLLMAVAVPLLCKALIAVLAHEGSEAAVHANVVHDVAELGEGVATGGADQELIGAAGVLVLLEKLHVASLCLI